MGRIRNLINEWKSVPCADCKNSFDPVCMDFDHRPDEIKLGNISSFLYDEDGLRAEIAKCDVVCACCHRLRTKSRGQSEKTKEKIRLAWSDPERRRKQSLTHRSPEVMKKRSESLAKTTSTPEFRQKMREVAAASASKKSLKMKAIWAAKRAGGNQ